MGSFQKFCLRWNNHTSNFVGTLGSLLNSENYSDVTVCCQGEVWHLHKLVLSAASCHFEQLLNSIPIGLSPALILDGPAASDISALIHFIYHGEVNVDQENLPSLLRTASSLKIKGLADVSSLGELGLATSSAGSQSSDTAVGPESASSNLFTLSHGTLNRKLGGIVDFNNGATTEIANYEILTGSNSLPAIKEETEEGDITPLNLSCNKRRSETVDCKEEIKLAPFSDDRLPKDEPHTVMFQELRPMKVENAERMELGYYPPSKKIRTVRPSEPASHVIHAETQTGSHLKYTPTPKIISHNASFRIRNLQESPSIQLSLKEELPDPVVGTKTATSTQTIIELNQKAKPEPATIVLPQGKNHCVSMEIDAPVNQIPILATSFPLQLLDMTLSSNASLVAPPSTYHQSSSIISTGNLTQHISSQELPPLNVPPMDQTPRTPSKNPADSTVTNVCLSYSSKEQITSKISEDVVLSDETHINQSLPLRPTCLPKYADASVGPAEEVETTFNHKKFSPCTIPRTPNTVHILQGVYNPNLLNGSSYKILNGKIAETIKSEPVTSQAPTSPSSQGIIVHSTAPTMVKLTPIAVNSNYTSKLQTTFASTSVVYSAATLKSPITSNSINGTIVSGPSSPPTVVSSSTLSSASPPIITDLAAAPQGGFNSKVTTSDEASLTQPFKQLQQPSDTIEMDRNSRTTSPQTPVSTALCNGQSDAGTPHNSQRVTINMRTFKEEWRKQLLVDYDPRTNMSICMLCFTTFKSYDGPRKNTYVKHAKRFHPTMEEYSDEERGVIISMYEKCHKHDIHMQKEINKSFRAPNGSSYVFKRSSKSTEGGLPSNSLNGISGTHSEVEAECHDEGSDPITESASDLDGTGSASLSPKGSDHYFKGKRKLPSLERGAQDSVSSSCLSPTKDESPINNNNISSTNNNNKNGVVLSPESSTQKEKSSPASSSSVTV